MRLSTITGVITLLILSTTNSRSVDAQTQISSSQARTDVAASLQKIDLDKKLYDPEKFKQRWSELLNDADQNKDAVLTESELRATLQERFARLDRDGSGLVNKQDAPKVYFGRKRFLAIFTELNSRMDADASGDISFDEFSNRAISFFQVVDSDADGHVKIEQMRIAISTSQQSQGD